MKINILSVPLTIRSIKSFYLSKGKKDYKLSKTIRIKRFYLSKGKKDYKLC